MTGRVTARDLVASGRALGLDTIDRPPVGHVVDLHDFLDVLRPLLDGVNHLLVFRQVEDVVDGAAAQRRREGRLVDRLLVHHLEDLQRHQAVRGGTMWRTTWTGLRFTHTICCVILPCVGVLKINVD